MCVSALIKVNIWISSTPWALSINLDSIQSSKRPSQTHNAQVLPKKPKAIYFGRATEWRLQIEDLFPDSEKNSCC